MITIERANEIRGEVFSAYTGQFAIPVYAEGELRDGTVSEPAALASEESARAQCVAWRGSWTDRARYNWTCTTDHEVDATGLIELTSGTLEEAIAASRATGARIKLTDEAGFDRGSVEPDGNYRLT